MWAGRNWGGYTKDDEAKAAAAAYFHKLATVTSFFVLCFIPWLMCGWAVVFGLDTPGKKGSRTLLYREG